MVLKKHAFINPLRANHNCSRQKSLCLYLSWFWANKIRFDISFESSTSRQFTWNFKPYLVLYSRDEICCRLLQILVALWALTAKKQAPCEQKIQEFIVEIIHILFKVIFCLDIQFCRHNLPVGIQRPNHWSIWIFIVQLLIFEPIKRQSLLQQTTNFMTSF